MATEEVVTGRDVRPGDVLVERAGYSVVKVMRPRFGVVRVWTLGGIRLEFGVTEPVRVLR